MKTCFTLSVQMTLIKQIIVLLYYFYFLFILNKAAFVTFPYQNYKNKSGMPTSKMFLRIKTHF